MAQNKKVFRADIFSVTVRQRGDLDGSLDLFTQAVQRAISQVNQAPELEIGGHPRRLNDGKKQDKLFFLNFITMVHWGPGRVSRDKPSAPMGLDPDEDYSHDTAVLYDHEEGLLFAEAHRPSMGPGAIARYLNQDAPPGTKFVLTPRIDEKAAAKIRSQKEMRSISIRVALGSASRYDRDEGLAATAAFGQEFAGNAGYMDLSVKLAREQETLSIRRVLNFISDIRKNEDEDVIRQVKVKGRENEDDPFTTIDLFHDRERRERFLPLDEGERKVLCQERWKALEEIRNEFVGHVA